MIEMPSSQLSHPHRVHWCLLDRACDIDGGGTAGGRGKEGAAVGAEAATGAWLGGRCGRASSRHGGCRWAGVAAWPTARYATGAQARSWADVAASAAGAQPGVAGWRSSDRVQGGRRGLVRG